MADADSATFSPKAVPTLDWQGCYDDQWGDLIVTDAYQHPAKFAKGLIERIVRFGLEHRYWRAGDLIGDPFGGVALGGIVAAYHGLRWIGVELEEKFGALGRANISLHALRLANLGAPLPELVQGDSRRFAEIVAEVAAVVTSPPYAASIQGDNAERETAQEGRKKRRTPGGGLGRGMRFGGYGVHPANIGNLPDEGIDGVVTSSPYLSGGHHPDQTGSWGGRLCDHAHKGMGSKKSAGYGDAPGQIGKAEGETYWQAMAAVYGQCWAAMKPGGVMAVVVKDYVKGGRRVPLCDQTLALLLHVGFVPVLRARAYLVRERITASLFGGLIVERTDRKSFFRRLYEADLPPDSPCRADWEEVLFVRKLERET